MSASLTSEPKLVRYPEGARQLSVSLNHIRNLVDAGFLTSVKVGVRGRRLLAAELDAIVKHGVEARRPAVRE